VSDNKDKKEEEMVVENRMNRNKRKRFWMRVRILHIEREVRKKKTKLFFCESFGTLI